MTHPMASIVGAVVGSWLLWTVWLHIAYRTTRWMRSMCLFGLWSVSYTIGWYYQSSFFLAYLPLFLWLVWLMPLNQPEESPYSLLEEEFDEEE